MNLSRRAFTCFVVGILLLLLYVHEQVSNLQVSYSIEKKEREMARLSEHYKIAKFRVARLRSPNVLNQRMKELSLDLTIPTDQEVVKVLRLRTISADSKLSRPAPFRFASWLHVMREAQAKTSSK